MDHRAVERPTATLTKASRSCRNHTEVNLATDVDPKEGRPFLGAQHTHLGKSFLKSLARNEICASYVNYITRKIKGTTPVFLHFNSETYRLDLRWVGNVKRPPVNTKCIYLGPPAICFCSFRSDRNHKDPHNSG